MLVSSPRLFDDLLDRESVVSQLDCQAYLTRNPPERQRRSWPAVAAGEVSLTFEPTVSCYPFWMTNFVTLVDRQLCGSQSLFRFAEPRTSDLLSWPQTIQRNASDSLQKQCVSARKADDADRVGTIVKPPSPFRGCSQRSTHRNQ
jgi:hypothetical protein